MQGAIQVLRFTYFFYRLTEMDMLEMTDGVRPINTRLCTFDRTKLCAMLSAVKNAVTRCPTDPASVHAGRRVNTFIPLSLHSHTTSRPFHRQCSGLTSHNQCSTKKTTDKEIFRDCCLISQMSSQQCKSIIHR